MNQMDAPLKTGLFEAIKKDVEAAGLTYNEADTLFIALRKWNKDAYDNKVKELKNSVIETK